MRAIKLFAFASVLSGCALYLGDADQDSGIPGPDPHGPGDPGCGGGGGGGGGGLPPSCGPTEVHVFGVYEAGDIGNHEHADAFVQIERPGSHHLVLSAYEPTTWHVSLGAGASIAGIHLVGYYQQDVDAGQYDLPITYDTAEQGGDPACGYSFPYNGQGCDTNQLLAIATARGGGEVTSFHGCYNASKWLLHADGHVDSDCNTGEGYEVNESFGSCAGGGGGGGDGDWVAQDFSTVRPSACTGERFVRFDATYNLYIGAILCGSSDRYKLVASDDPTKPFADLADYAGEGQDHCELVNPAFTIPDEDDITSGGCTSCADGGVDDVQDVPVYARANFGQPFERVTATYWADLTTPWYQCGVSIP